MLIFIRVRKMRKNTEVLWCFRCKGTRPARAHHCSKCGCCVEQMDHHCPWIQRCVGKENRAHFIQFLLVASVGLILQQIDAIRFTVRTVLLVYSNYNINEYIINFYRRFSVDNFNNNVGYRFAIHRIFKCVTVQHSKFDHKKSDRY